MLSLSLSLSRARKQQHLAFFGRSTPKRRLQQLLKRFSSPTKEREREIPRRKRYRLYRHKFDRSLQNRTPKRSALETEKTRPCSSSQKKKLEAIGTIRTFFGTWTLFAIGAVVKVVEVIIIILSSKRVKSSFEWRKKEDKKIQKNKIIFPLDSRLFPSKSSKIFSLSFFLFLSKRKTPHLGFSFFTYVTLN